MHGKIPSGKIDVGKPLGVHQWGDDQPEMGFLHERGTLGRFNQLPFPLLQFISPDLLVKMLI